MGTVTFVETGTVTVSRHASRVRGSSPSRMAVTGRWIHLDRRYSHRAGSKREFSSARLPSPGAHPGRRQSARASRRTEDAENGRWGQSPFPGAGSRGDGDSHLFARGRTGTDGRGQSPSPRSSFSVFSGGGLGWRRGQSPFPGREMGTVTFRGDGDTKKSVASPLLQTRGDYKARDLRTTRRRACSPVTSGAS